MVGFSNTQAPEDERQQRPQQRRRQEVVLPLLPFISNNEQDSFSPLRMRRSSMSATDIGNDDIAIPTLQGGDASMIWPLDFEIPTISRNFQGAVAENCRRGSTAVADTRTARRREGHEASVLQIIEAAIAIVEKDEEDWFRCDEEGI